MEKFEENIYLSILSELKEIRNVLLKILEKQSTPVVLTQATKQDSNVNRNSGNKYR
jgi:hypothetical protein